MLLAIAGMRRPRPPQPRRRRPRRAGAGSRARCGSWSPRTSASRRSTTTCGVRSGRRSRGSRRPAPRSSRTRPAWPRRSQTWSAIAVADARYADAERYEPPRAVGADARGFIELRRLTSPPASTSQAQMHARADPPRVRRPVRAHRRVGAAHAHARRARRSSTAPTIRPRSAARRSIRLARLVRLPLRRQPRGPARLRGAGRASATTGCPCPCSCWACAATTARCSRPPRPSSGSSPSTRQRPPDPPDTRRPVSTIEATPHAPLSGVSEIRAPSCARTTRRCSSSRRPRSTCWGSTAGCATSSTSPTTTRSRARHPRVFVPPTASAATSRRSRTSTTTCCATPRCARRSRRTGRAASSRS